MSFLSECLPMVIFFVMFRSKGLIIATVITVLFSCLQLILMKLLNYKISMIQLFSVSMLAFFALFAIFFRKQILIQWKPTVIYWILAMVTFFAPYFGKKTLVEKMYNNCSNKIQLSSKIINILNRVWIMFFILMGILNLYVVYFYDTNTWVNFKLFGTLGITILFILVQIIWIYKYSFKTN